MNHGHPSLATVDEHLLHQTPWPARHASSSDVRFFDRYWLTAADPGGSAGLITGIGYYKNTGSCDGYTAIQAGDHQHNVRFSRAWTTTSTNCRWATSTFASWSRLNPSS